MSLSFPSWLRNLQTSLYSANAISADPSLSNALNVSSSLIEIWSESVMVGISETKQSLSEIMRSHGLIYLEKTLPLGNDMFNLAETDPTPLNGPTANLTVRLHSMKQTAKKQTVSATWVSFSAVGKFQARILF